MLSANYSEFSSVSILLLCIHVVRKLQRFYIRQKFPSLCMLSAKFSDIASASSFLLCVYCPQNNSDITSSVFFPFCLFCLQNVATFHTSIISFFAYIVRIIKRRFIRQQFPSLYMLSANHSEFSSVSSFPLCICCPQITAILHPLAVSFFVYVVRKIQRYCISLQFASLPILSAKCCQILSVISFFPLPILYAKCSDIYLSVVSLFVYAVRTS